MKKQGLINGLKQQKHVCLSVFLQFRLAGWLAEVLRRWCFLWVFLLKASSSSSGVCTFLKSKFLMCVHPVPRMLQKTSRLLGVLLMGFEPRFSSVIDTKVWGQIVRQNQWCLLQVCRKPLLAGPVCVWFPWSCRHRACFSNPEPLEKCFHSPIFSCSAWFSSANQSDPHYSIRHLCVCVYTYTHSVEE